MNDAISDRPLRLAFLGDPDSPHMRRWTDFFVGRGHEIHLLVPAHDRIREDNDPRLYVHRFTAWPKLPVRGVGSLITGLALRRALGAIRPDVLHAHALSRYGVAARLSGFHPYVVTVWGSDVLIVMRRSRRLRLHARLALAGADLVTGGSQDLIRAAIAAGAHAERTRFVHFGVDTTRFAPGPDPVGLRGRLDLEGRRVVLSNRAISGLYRQIVVVEALAALPPDVTVVMTRRGSVGAEIAEVERRAAELGVADRVRIVPVLDERELPDLYRLADVVVSVPASDGGPTTVAEALAVGRPVVATDLPGVREWLGELDPAALVPVDDPAATAKAIRVALERPPAERASLALRSRDAVEQRASRRSNMLRMERLYRELAARRSKGAAGMPRVDVA